MVSARQFCRSLCCLWERSFPSSARRGMIASLNSVLFKRQLLEGLFIMKRIGILTAGGDTPALNATIPGAVVRSNQLKIEIYGFIKGFNCFFNPRVPHVHLNPLYQGIPELDPTKGGTLIGSSRDYVDPERKDELDLIVLRLKKLGIEGLICIG